ncbi:MAG TPA: hypothetical protein VGG70_01860 [Candidatus Cybelea sp.]|jgi:hypothetical protein
MRLSLAAASLATAVALLAGCTGSPQSSLPSASQGAANNGGGNELTALPKVMSREQVSKLHPSVVPKQILEKALQRHRYSHIKIDKSAKPSMVLTDEGGYIFWLSKKGTITSYATDCSGVEGGVIDHQGRLVVACTNTSSINIYNKGNTTGPADVVLKDTSGFYPADAFEDNQGNIFATNLYGFTCGTSTCNSYNGNIVWWTANNQSAGSSPSGTYSDPNLYQDYFADVDANGNVYVDGLYCTFGGVYGCYYGSPEVDTITNIMGSAPTATNDNVTLNSPGGINALANGQISVLDQGCTAYSCGLAALYLFNALPGTPAATLTPPQNFRNSCDPVAAGYSKGDKEVLLGDPGCRAGERGKISSQSWKSLTSIYFNIPVAGGFLKSDK